MKKMLASLAVVAIVASAQAVTFSWNTASKVLFNGASTIAETGAITAHLFYLGATSTITIENYALTGEFDAAQKATTSTGVVANKGKYTSTFSAALSPAEVINGQNFTAGDFFTVLLTYNDGATTWYNLATTPWQLPLGTTDITTGLTATFTHSYTMNAPGTALTAGGGWVTPVPEPATAALALAGLAMLIRRRK